MIFSLMHKNSIYFQRNLVVALHNQEYRAFVAKFFRPGKPRNPGIEL